MSSSHISNIYLVKESNNIIVQFNMAYTQLQVVTQMQMNCDKILGSSITVTSVTDRRIYSTRFLKAGHII
ncbi:hypothetical protein L1887_34181 [Cichorium endivia]|nr:hypothetical protein L1887_34181 [Cichorium endivia]